MDCRKVGNLILTLRKEKNMTQKNLANILNVSDRTISKWERGLGCPDISLLPALSAVFDVNIEKILLGDLTANGINGGNMKKIRFYICPDCKNILCCSGAAEISCCSRKLSALVAQQQEQLHKISIEKIETDFYINLHHDMHKSHYISFVAYVTYDRILLIKLYPEQEATVRFAQMYPGDLYIYCTKHGLIKHPNIHL